MMKTYFGDWTKNSRRILAKIDGKEGLLYLHCVSPAGRSYGRLENNLVVAVYSFRPEFRMKTGMRFYSSDTDFEIIRGEKI